MNIFFCYNVIIIIIIDLSNSTFLTSFLVQDSRCSTKFPQIMTTSLWENLHLLLFCSVSQVPDSPQTWFSTPTLPIVFWIDIWLMEDKIGELEDHERLRERYYVIFLALGNFSSMDWVFIIPSLSGRASLFGCNFCWADPCHNASSQMNPAAMSGCSSGSVVAFVWILCILGHLVASPPLSLQF